MFSGARRSSLGTGDRTEERSRAGHLGASPWHAEPSIWRVAIGLAPIQMRLMDAAAGVELRLVASSGSGRLALEAPAARLSG
jgi:hypothetical protein